MMEEYMLRANIDRYTELLRNPVDEAQRHTLERLLVEATEALRRLFTETAEHKDSDRWADGSQRAI